MNNPREVLTVGHSSHPFGDFVALLRRQLVAVVADVRSVPYSRRYPQFNRRALEGSLGEHDIHYVFLGAELGARSRDASCYDAEGRIRFSRLSETGIFLQGIERVIEGAASTRMALLCAERDPANCHRAILVAPVLRERGVTVHHLLPDGSLESQEQLRERLADTAGMPARDLFRTREQRLDEAMRRRARQIAYQDPARVRTPSSRP